MSGEAIDTLCAILENGGGRFRLAAYREADIELLFRAGLVVRDGVVASVPCDNCDRGHMANVRRGEGDAWGYRCPEAGFIELPPQEIAAGQVHLDEFLSRLAGALPVALRARANLSERIMPLGNFFWANCPALPGWQSVCLRRTIMRRCMPKSVGGPFPSSALCS